METSTSQVTLYKCLGTLAIFGLILSLIGDFILSLYWVSIIGAIFKIFIVAALVLVEFRQSPILVKPFSFMFFFLGRGIFYLVLAFITMGLNSVAWAGGAIIAVVGVVFIGLHFVVGGREPEYMSFTRFQRLTSGMSHELPTTTQQYPVAHQVPLAQHNNPNNGSVSGQYNNTQSNNTNVTPNPVSPTLPVHISNDDKTEV